MGRLSNDDMIGRDIALKFGVRLDPAPVRIQLSRKKGWRMPPRTVNCARPHRLGNKWVVGNPGAVMMGRQRVVIGPALTAAGAIARLKAWLAGEFGTSNEGGAFEHPLFGFVMVPPGRDDYLIELKVQRGQNMACWCRLCAVHAAGRPLGVLCDYCDPCHVDHLLELANR